jgi:MFS family permease
MLSSSGDHWNFRIPPIPPRYNHRSFLRSRPKPLSNSPKATIEFFALNRNISILLAALVGMGFAEELWMRFLPKYLETLGAAVWAIGLFDAIKTWIGAVYAYPGGIVTDRWGHRRALRFFTLVSLAGYMLLLLIPHWAGVLAASFLFLAWSSLSLPATFSLVGSSLAANKYAMGIGVQATVKRVPIIIAPLAGGMLIDHYGVVEGTRIGIGVAVLLAILTLGLQRQIRESQSSTAIRPRLTFRTSVQNFDPALRRLLLSDILVRFCERIPYAWVVLYSMNEVGVNATQFGLLTGIEMVTAMVCLIPVAYLSDKYGREPFIVATFIFFTLFPISMLFANGFGGLVVAFTIRGLKEFGETARKSLIIQLAPEPARGQTVGAYYLVRDCLATLAAFLGAALWQFSPQANFVGAAVVGAAGTSLYIWTQHRHDRRCS